MKIAWQLWDTKGKLQNSKDVLYSLFMWKKKRAVLFCARLTFIAQVLKRFVPRPPKLQWKGPQLQKTMNNIVDNNQKLCKIWFSNVHVHYLRCYFTSIHKYCIHVFLFNILKAPWDPQGPPSPQFGNHWLRPGARGFHIGPLAIYCLPLK